MIFIWAYKNAWLSTIFFQNFAGFVIFKKKIQDFPEGMGTLIASPATKNVHDDCSDKSSNQEINLQLQVNKKISKQSG